MNDQISFLPGELDDTATLTRLGAFLKRNHAKCGIIDNEGRATYLRLDPLMLLSNAQADTESVHGELEELQSERDAIFRLYDSEAFNDVLAKHGLLTALEQETISCAKFYEVVSKAWPEGQMPPINNGCLDLVDNLIAERDFDRQSLDAARSGDLSRDSMVNNLQSANAGLRDAVQRLQFSKINEAGVRCCPLCGFEANAGHASDCACNVLATDAGEQLAAEISELRRIQAMSDHWQMLVENTAQALGVDAEQMEDAARTMRMQSDLWHANGADQSAYEIIVQSTAAIVDDLDGQDPGVTTPENLETRVHDLLSASPLAKQVCLARSRFNAAVARGDKSGAASAAREEEAAYRAWSELAGQQEEA